MFQFTDFFQSSNSRHSMFMPHSLGMEVCQKGHSFQARYRDYHLIHYVVSGQGTLEINQSCYKIQKHMAFFIPAGIKAGYEADRNVPWSYCWTGFYASPDDIRHIVPGHSQGMVYPAFDTLEIWNIILHFFQQKSSFRDYSEKAFSTGQYHLEINYDRSRSFSMSSVLYEIFSRLPLPEPCEPAPSANASHIREYLDDNYSRPVQICEIARLFSMHPAYLSAVFRKEYRISPKGYLIQKRIESAAQLLHATDLSIKQIAACVGYANQLEFTQLFKNIPANHRLHTGSPSCRKTLCITNDPASRKKHHHSGAGIFPWPEPL